MSGEQTGFKQRAQDFKSLATALQSNDLSSAQQAFASLQKDMQSASGANGQSQSKSANPVSQDFQNLQNALQSGDLSGAQQAFAALKQNFHSARTHHHHHASGAKAESNASTSPSPTTGNPQTTPTNSTSATGLNQLA
jgi:hypothetical protein